MAGDPARLYGSSRDSCRDEFRDRGGLQKKARLAKAVAAFHAALAGELEDAAEKVFVAAFQPLLQAVVDAYRRVGEPARHLIVTQDHATLGPGGRRKLKPDVLAMPHDYGGGVSAIPSYEILFVLEAKVTTAAGLVSGECLGQIMQYLHEVLDANPNRHTASGILFNQMHAVAVTMTRERDVDEIVTTAQYSDLAPWKDFLPVLLYKLVVSPPEAHRLPTFGEPKSHCADFLGVGATSVVYKLSDGESVLKLGKVPVCRGGAGEEYTGCGEDDPFATEAAMLAMLTGIPGVPRLLSEVLMFSGAGFAPVPYLVMAPVCQPFGGKGVQFRQAHAVELGNILLAVGAKNVVHRDIRPANVMHDSEGHVHLLDWGFAVTAGSSAVLKGTLRCASPSFLLHFSRTPLEPYTWSRTDDWHSWLRCCLLLAYPDLHGLLDCRVAVEGDRIDAAAAEGVCGFWTGVFAANPRWGDVDKVIEKVSRGELELESTVLKGWCEALLPSFDFEVRVCDLPCIFCRLTSPLDAARGVFPASTWRWGSCTNSRGRSGGCRRCHRPGTCVGA